MYGLNVVKLQFEWGKSVDCTQVEAKLKAEPDIKVVYTTLSETSTGVENDIETLGRIVRNSPAALVVDAVSGMAAIPFKTDEWNVDVVVVGSQKGLMIPPGLAFAALSEKAWTLVKNSKLPKYYFSYEKALKSLKAEKLPDTPYTSSVSLVIQLHKALELIKAEGIENIWKRHALLAGATREAVKAIGLSLFVSGTPSNAVTSIKMPEGVDASALLKKIRDEYGITLAGGQGQIKGKIFRIAHLGYVDRLDVIMTIAAVEMALSELGYPVKLGSGVSRAQELLLSGVIPAKAGVSQEGVIPAKAGI